MISADGVGLLGLWGRGLSVDLYGILGLSEAVTNVLRVGLLDGLLDGPLVGVLGLSVTDAFSMVATGFLGLYLGLEGLDGLGGLTVVYLLFFTNSGWKSLSSPEVELELSTAAVLANHSFW